MEEGVRVGLPEKILKYALNHLKFFSFFRIAR
jgi:hypothetical protein